MGVDHSMRERRQFGRRWSHVHGWIAIEGRPRIPCVIRNFSETGALIDLDDPSRVLNRFRLTIDAIDFAVECEVRHHGRNSVGVRFLADRADDAPQIIHTIDELMARAMATDSPRIETPSAAVSVEAL